MDVASVSCGVLLKENHTFRDPKVSKLGSMLDLVLGGVLEASWSDLERFFGLRGSPSWGLCWTSFDGKRLCDPIAARNVVFRLAPQEKYL